MSEMRFNPITLDWVIMASDRSMKPNDFRKEDRVRPELPPCRENCPFCVGNEHLSAQEIARACDKDGSWQVRVVANKYPAFSPMEVVERHNEGTFRSLSAAGAHEVVIEHPKHNVALSDFTAPHVRALFGLYRERYEALRLNPAVESIVIFKNHGERAGTSLEHPHSQITAAPIVSAQVEARLQEARRYHQKTGDCLYCRVLADELEAGVRIVEESESFVAFIPYASLSPYHLWIFPRQHASSFGAIGDCDLDHLADILSRQLRHLHVALGDPDYNFMIRSSPARAVHSPYYHWYVAIVPRVSHLAGFELGSGTYINSSRPEHCAEVLRSAAVMN